MRASIVVCIVVLLSCGRQVPADVLKPAEMEKVLWDYLQVESFVNNFVVKDSLAKPIDTSAVYLQRLYKKHNTTAAEFNRSLRHYAANEDLMRALLDSMNRHYQKPFEQKVKEVAE